MDEIETRLRRDAEKIRIETSPELRARLEASLNAVRDTRSVSAMPSVPGKARQSPSWWLSALTGVAALLLVVFFTNREAPKGPGEDSLSVENRRPNDMAISEDWFVIDGLTLKIKSADLTESLDEELLNLQSDLEKARDSVERDMKIAF